MNLDWWGWYIIVTCQSQDIVQKNTNCHITMRLEGSISWFLYFFVTNTRSETKLLNSVELMTSMIDSSFAIGGWWQNPTDGHESSTWLTDRKWMGNLISERSKPKLCCGLCFMSPSKIRNLWLSRDSLFWHCYLTRTHILNFFARISTLDIQFIKLGMLFNQLEDFD